MVGNFPTEIEAEKEASIEEEGLEDEEGIWVDGKDGGESGEAKGGADFGKNRWRSGDAREKVEEKMSGPDGDADGKESEGEATEEQAERGSDVAKGSTEEHRGSEGENGDEDESDEKSETEKGEG